MDGAGAGGGAAGTAAGLCGATKARVKSPGPSADWPDGSVGEAAGLRVPISEAALPCSEDALGRDAQAALNALRLPLREELKRDVGSIFGKHFENCEDPPVCNPPSA